MTGDAAGEARPGQPVTVYLLLDADGALLRTEAVSGWAALERLDREAREIRGLLVPLLGARDYRRASA